MCPMVGVVSGNPGGSGLLCVPKPLTACLWGSVPCPGGLGITAALHPLTPAPTSLQEARKLDEVMQELRALRALVKEQGERIGRLEEQLGRMENGDA